MSKTVTTRKILAILVSVLAAVVTAALIWRKASRHYRSPCPSQLAWILDNPLTNLAAGPAVTLDRIGLRPGEHGLDVGCGPGRLALPAAERVGPAGSITAVDVQPAMLARLRSRMDAAGISNINPRLEDVSDNPDLPPGSFDRAWLVTVLGEIPDRATALRNIHRLLKPGGTLSITEICPDPHYQRRKTVLGLAQAAGFEPAAYWGAWYTYTQNFIRK
jgi:SAM-dependent methyltransferase